MKRLAVTLIFLIMVSMICQASACAEESGANLSPPKITESSPGGPQAKRRPSKGKHPREKEAEGTEARDRFQADTVLKSKYELDGRTLEVDPD
ncbi:hypothetical protein WDW37_03725 [Bdellovibrionota bacterium FG-1]